MKAKRLHAACCMILQPLSPLPKPQGLCQPPLPPNLTEHRRTLIVLEVADESMSQRSVMRVVDRAYGLYRVALPGLALLAFCR